MLESVVGESSFHHTMDSWEWKTDGGRVDSIIHVYIVVYCVFAIHIS